VEDPNRKVHGSVQRATAMQISSTRRLGVTTQVVGQIGLRSARQPLVRAGPSVSYIEGPVHPVSGVARTTVQPGSAPVATGSVGSLDHCDQDPGYSPASNPAIAKAATSWAAEIPDPQ
jgi:hypothetical protein